METRKFSLKSVSGSWRMLAIFVATMLLCSFFANLIISREYRVSVSNITYEVRGAELSLELYKPTNVDSTKKLPCMILAHGGSESLPATSMLAWEFAKRGFVVLNVSAYSAALSEQPAINDDGTCEKNYFRGGTQGYYDALQYARSISYVDKTRIGMWGHSAGYYCVSAAVAADGDHLTLNDRMLNVLYNNFGVKITEDQLTQNAGDIAAAKLNKSQLELYSYMKTEQKAICDNYVRAARLVEFVFGQKVKVAGFEVKRDPQVNAMVGLGTHEGKGSYNLGASDGYKAIFHTGADAVARNGWYNISNYTVDSSATSKLIGQLYSTTVTGSGDLKSAISNRSARLFLSPETFHNGMLWDWRAIRETIEFYTQTLGYNNGNIGAADAKPIPSSSLGSSYLALACTTLSFFAMIAMLIALASMLLKTEFFARCAGATYEAKLSVKSAEFYVAAVLAAVASFIGAYLSSNEDVSFSWSNATATKWLPWEPGQMRTFLMLLGTAGVGLALFAIFMAIFRKKNDSGFAGVSDLKINFGWAAVLKTVLLGAILFAAGYISAVFIKGAFNSRFVFVDGSFELMKPYGFMRLLKYAVILLPFTLIISSLNNLWMLKKVGGGADTAINVIVTSLGAELLLLIGFIGTYSSPQHAVVFHLHAILSLIVLVPVMNYLFRKLFKMTGSVWAGAIFVALLLGWRLASYISHQFIYWGPNALSAFWGLY
jgi:hypothetical protein